MSDERFADDDRMKELVPDLERQFSELYKLTQSFQNKIDMSSQNMFVKMRGHIKQSVSDTVDALKFLKEHSEKTAEHIERSTERMHKATKEHSKAYEKSRAHISKYHPNNLLPSALGFVGENIPAIAGWALVIKTMEDLSKHTEDLLVSFGGSHAQVKQFTDSLIDVQMDSQLSSDQVLDLGKAFRTAGFDITNNATPHLQDYLRLSGESMQMFGLSAEVAAQYGKNMIDSGASVADMGNNMQNLYDIMQKQNLSVQEMNASMTAAVSLVENFGAIATQSVSEMSEQVARSIGLFRSLGLESAKAGALMQSNMSDPNKRMQIAAFMSSQNGGDMFANAYKLGTAEGLQGQLEASMKYLNKNFAIRDTMNMSDRDKGLYGTQLQSNMMMAAQAGGITPDMLNVLVKDFSAEKHKNPALSIDEFFKKRQEESEAQGKGMASWTEGLNKLKSDFSNLGPALEVTLGSLAQIAGGPLLDAINLILPPFNAFLKMVVAVVNNPVGKFLVELAVGTSLVVAGFAAWAPLVASLSAALTAISGAVMFTYSNLLIFGTAVTSAMTYVGGLSGALSFLGGAVTWLIGLFEPVAALSAAIALLANPITWVVAGVVALGSAIYIFRDQIGKVFGGLSHLFDGSTKAGGPTGMLSAYAPVIDLLINRLKDFFLQDLLKGIFDIVNHLGSWGQDALKTVQNFGNGLLHGAGELTKSAGSVLDTLTKGQPVEAASLRSAASLTGDKNQHMMQNALIVAQEARKVGADPITALAAMMQESHGNERAHGDYGYYTGHRFISDPKHLNPASTWTSAGLFQLHKGGKLGSLSMEQAFDPQLNAHIALQQFGKLHAAHPEWTPGMVAATSQAPADKLGYAQSVNHWIPFATEMYEHLQSADSVIKAAEPDVSKYREAQGLGAEHSTLKGIHDELKKIAANQDKAQVANDKHAKVAKQALQIATNTGVADAQYLSSKVGANII